MGESSNTDKDCQGDAAVDQSADAIQKSLSISESEPELLNKEMTRPGQGKESNRLDKSSKNKKDTVRTNQHPLEQNANVDFQDKAKRIGKKGKDEQDQQQKEASALKQQMVFGPQKMVDLTKILIVKAITVYFS